MKIEKNDETETKLHKCFKRRLIIGDITYLSPFIKTGVNLAVKPEDSTLLMPKSATGHIPKPFSFASHPYDLSH
jgi:hypothetical protein